MLARKYQFKTKVLVRMYLYVLCCYIQARHPSRPEYVHRHVSLYKTTMIWIMKTTKQKYAIPRDHINFSS